MPDEARWFKDAVIYELHVRSFFDSLGDGMGDFGGLTQKLDYLQDLGITAIWLLPFYPSPLKDDGYDIADYRNIHPDYGTLESFREFLDAAHQRGLKVITELVLNHTSDQHPWFQKARRAAPGSVERDFYVWSDTPHRYLDVPIVFKDFEPSNWTYDSVAGAYYWHRFYSHQPDLNFDNPAVKDAVFPIVDFWLEMGVDGLRLDAVPYLFEREGTSCTGLPETHAFLRDLRRHVDSRYLNRMLLAEANVWPEDAVTYFGEGRECHMAFHFPLMPRLFMSLFRENRVPIMDILEQTPEIPESCQWALFLRNHDELTLEMVTEEERDAMYRAYAHDSQARINVGIRRRLTPLLSNNRRRIELMNGLLFSLPGSPVIYYGDEIGMGDNIFLGDRNSVRTPMQWSSDRNAGFSRANPQKLFLPITIDPEYHFESVNVEAQQSNPHSLLWWTKRIIDVRKRTLAFSRGTLKFLHPVNRKVLAFLRQYEGQTVLVIANLSRFAQHVELDLTEFAGNTPVELFGGERFPLVSQDPYVVMLGPHAFYWFELCSTVPERICALPARTFEQVRSLAVRDSWTEVSTREDDVWIQILSAYLECRLMDNATPHMIGHIKIRDWLAFPAADPAAETLLLIIDLHHFAGEPFQVVLPLRFADDSKAEELLETQPGSVVARVVGGQSGLLYDPLTDADFANGVLRFFASQRRLRSHKGNELVSWLSAPFEDSDQSMFDSKPRFLEVEQFNVSVVFEEQLVLKLLTHIGEGPHPEVEIGQLLDHCQQPCAVPPLRGYIELRGRRQSPMTLATLYEFVTNEGDAWQYSLDMLSLFFEGVVTCDPLIHPPGCENWRTLTMQQSKASEVIPGSPDELLDEYLKFIRQLASRTAALHLALASNDQDPAFAPEPFTAGYQRSIYQAMRASVLETCDALEQSFSSLPESVVQPTQTLLKYREDLLRLLRRVVDQPLEAIRIRCHGDFHLGQVLITGTDCVIIDFEGRALLPLSERRIKRSPLRDIATILRSLDYASRTALAGLASQEGRMPGMIRAEDLPRIIPWYRYWQNRVPGEFMVNYLNYPGIHRVLPKAEHGLQILLDAFLTERCLIDVGHEFHNRPDWLSIALEGTLTHLNQTLGVDLA